MSRSRTLWEEGHAPGGRVVALVVVVSVVAVLLDLALLDRVGLLFDLVFVALCVAAALLVRLRDFFVVGVLPPLLMLGLCLGLALTRRDAIARVDDGAVQAVVSGLSHHSIALGCGYALCLGVLGLRDRLARGLVRPGGLSRARLRSGPGLRHRPAAPAARRRTSRPPSSAQQGSPPPR